jgi:GntR family transcriptional regulator, transcriptional repressor for pyruvate dehydrogenase complex
MEPVRPIRAVDAATVELRAAILGGAFAIGADLPPERILAGQLGINRLTLRAGLARLEAEGLVEAKQGRSVRVVDWTRRAGLDLLVPLLTESVAADAAADERLVCDLMLLRRVALVSAIGLASQRATRSDVERLERLAAGGRLADGAIELLDAHLAWARGLLDAAGSVPLQFLYNTVERVLRLRPDLAARALEDRAAVNALAERTPQLVAARDPEQAQLVLGRALAEIDARSFPGCDLR